MPKDKQDKRPPSGTGDQEEEGSLFLNIGKIVFLVIVLIASWFLLEWLMGHR